MEGSSPFSPELMQMLWGGFGAPELGASPGDRSGCPAGSAGPRDPNLAPRPHRKHSRGRGRSSGLADPCEARLRATGSARAPRGALVLLHLLWPLPPGPLAAALLHSRALAQASWRSPHLPSRVCGERLRKHQGADGVRVWAARRPDCHWTVGPLPSCQTSSAFKK